MVWIRAVRPTLLALLALCACIERPWQDTPQKREVDRGALADVLLTAVPPGLTPVGAVFGGSAELVGYRLEPAALVPGQRMRLTLVWRCRAELDSWRIFVHLDDTAGSRIHAEHDPAGGRYPTDAWRPWPCCTAVISMRSSAGICPRPARLITSAGSAPARC